VTEETKAFLRSLPILLLAAVLLLGGAWATWLKGNNTLSTAVAAVGVFLLGSWSATAVADWSKAHRNKKEEEARAGD
jgi:hypothetical protein